MRKILLSIIILLFSNNNIYAEKHALIIAIGDYPKDSGWGFISSLNDVPLIKEALMNHGFKSSNFTLLKDNQATYANIKNTITEFTSKLKLGDIAVIHFSGHGQPIWDTNNDEIDGYDEAWVPYDAMANYDVYGYKGENHLRDDELGDMFIKIRNKLGKDGQLLILMDSCHSGTASRGPIGDIHRGSFFPFQPEDYDPVVKDDNEFSIIDREKTATNAAPFVAISGAAARELNYEYDGVGSLTFAFAKAMTSLPDEYTYRQVFSKIESKMNIIAPSQRPTIEGNGVDFKLFKNEYVTQKPYFPITKILAPNKLRIRGGKIQNLLVNTTVFVCKAGTIQPKEGNIIAKGKIESSKYNESTIVLDSNFKFTNAKDIWVFVDQLSYEDISVKLYFHPSVKENTIKDSISEFLQKNNLGSVVKDTWTAELAVVNDKGIYKLLSPGSLKFFEKNRGPWALEDLKQKIFNYAQGKYLKNLELNNSFYSFEFELLPAKINTDNQRVIGLLDKDSFIDEQGNFKVRPGKDYVVLKVTNTGKKPVYFSIVEINSKGEIAPFMPNPIQTFTDNERYLLPNQTKIFKEKPFRFGPPYEKLTLKGFSSNKQLDLSPIITRSAPIRARSPLEKFIDKSYTKKRGNLPVTPDEKVDGFSYKLVYEVVK
ncbi:caspase family protein [uncultured Aquimarina sp.]|uniref:caspase family protein n=1 Tax=uncultured Aquimarina sp. TaxID=575652 RepID=UPI00260ABACD|nr:caspase family protein [uncultured Aquimarina sp.]